MSTQQNLKQLPEGWKWMKLGEVVSNLDGKRVPLSKNVRAKRKGEYRYYGATEIVDYIDDYIFEGEHLLVGEDGANLLSKSKALAFIVDGKFWVNNHAHVLKTKSISSNKYLCYYFNSLNLAEYVTGTAQPKLSQGNLNKIVVPISPLSTQTAIVAKIEELFSELDKGIEQLKTAQQQLKTYRQAVLKWAFEGRLTNESVKDGELPVGWRIASIEEIATVGTGATPLKSKSEYYGGNIPWVTSGALNEEFVREATDFVTEKAIKETNLSIYPKHSLLVAMYGEGKTRGKCSELLIEACTNQAIAAIYFTEHDISIKPYLKYFLLKNYQDVRKKSSGGVQPNLNLGIIKKLQFPLPPDIKEQNKVVEEIESRLSVADKMEESITQSLQQAEALRQSILKQAFEGRLVLEDTNTISTADDKSVETPVAVGAKVIQMMQEEFPREITSITQIDLHAGIIAMIIDAHIKNPKHLEKLSHVKCEKIAHLVEQKIGISLGRVPVKDAAGPDDYPHLKKVEHRASKAGYFKTVALPIGHTYTPLRNLNTIIEKTKAALPEKELNEIENLIKLFLPFKLEHAELVATIYAGWNNLLLTGLTPTDEDIVYESRENWSERKLTIKRPNFFDTLSWMKNHDFVPKGMGQIVAFPIPKQKRK